MPGLVVVGELNPDIVVSGVPYLDGRPGLQQVEDLVEATSVVLGSSAAITATAAARAGAAPALVAVVGDDVLGRQCLAWAAELGVDVDRVRVEPGSATGSTVILVSDVDAGRRRMLTHLGTMSALRVEDVDLTHHADVRHLHVSSFFMHTGARQRLHEVFERARSQGVVTSLDPNDDPEEAWASGVNEMVAHSDLVFCNEREARGITGAGPAVDALGLAHELLSRLPDGPDPRFPAVVLKLGGDGAMAVTRSGRVHVSAPAMDVVDTVGAGDTLAGTVLAHLLAGSAWATALPLAVAAASISTTAAGGTAAGPEPAQVEALAATLTATAAEG